MLRLAFCQEGPIVISWQYSMLYFYCIRERECAPGAGRQACTDLRQCTRTDRVPSGASLSFAFGFRLVPLWREVAVQGTPAFFSRFLSRCCTYGVALPPHTFALCSALIGTLSLAVRPFIFLGRLRGDGVVSFSALI